jgi:NADPH-dependent 2,4-dienoyl-CoA reductase/sulfur reductase-like enzyme
MSTEQVAVSRPGGGRVVVLGAGQAGGWAAATVRARGHQGPITLIGAEPYPPYERPALSKEFLRGAVAAGQVAIKAPAFYQQADITLRLGEAATRLDRENRRVLLAGGGAEPYDTLVLATGARPRRLGVPGGADRRVHYLRGIDDAVRLRAALAEAGRVAVIGGGLIGMEIAASAASMGRQVVVLEQADQVLGRVLPPLVSQHLVALHAAHGVRVRTGVGVNAIEFGGSSVRVSLDDGQAVLADCVVVGIGVAPNTELAAAAGIEVGDGVLTDQYGVTSDRSVVAVGDVSRHYNPLLRRHVRLECWHNALNQAVTVGGNLVAAAQPYREVPWSWSAQYGVNVQIAGLVEDWSAPIVRRVAGRDDFGVLAVRQGRLVGAVTVDQPREMRAARSLIARQVELDLTALRDPGTSLATLARSRA